MLYVEDTHWLTLRDKDFIFTSETYKIWCFSFFKCHYSLIMIGCLDDIVWVVNLSATPNVAKLVGNQDGNTVFQCMNGARTLIVILSKQP